MLPQPIVRVERLGKTFGDKPDRRTVALEEVNLQVQPGEFITLIGPSGCGKSTLLRLIGDLLTPTTGRVVVNGKSARQARLDHDYAIVFQAPVLFEWRTVRGNVELPLELFRVERGERERRASALLDLVRLGEFSRNYPWQLSGGMQQRVAIARALAARPALLLMDEPFGALDELTRERMNGELLDLARRTGTTVLFVTHSIPEAVFLSDRVAVMSARPGRIAEQIEIDLPAPRGFETRASPRYFELVTRVRESLRATAGE